MKSNIKITLLNGIKTKATVDFDVYEVYFSKSKKMDKIFNSTACYSKLNSELNQISKIYKLSNEPFFVNFKVNSPSIENLIKKNVKIDYEDLAYNLALGIIYYLLTDFYKEVKQIIFDENYTLNLLIKNLDKNNKINIIFANKFENTNPKNPLLNDLNYQIEHKEYEKALITKNALQKISLNSDETKELDILSQRLNYKLNNLSDNDIFYNYVELKDKYQYDKGSLKILILDCIKYLEDKREFWKAKKEFLEFDKIFLEEEVDDQKGLYYYLKGRMLYGEGYFIEALQNLKKSYDNYTNNPLGLSDVYNTSSNCFNDTMYFNYGKFLGTSALNIRKQFNSTKLFETYGVLGYNAFRTKDYSTAFNYFSLSLDEQKKLSIPRKDMNRTFNSLAKCSIFLDKFDEAEKYLAEGLEEASNLNSKQISFSYLYYLLFYYKLNDEKNFVKYFKYFADPDNYCNYDYFALGWAYLLNSLTLFDKYEYNLAYNFLNDSINFFIKDNYFIEAFNAWLYSIKFFDEKHEYFGNPELFPKLINFIQIHYNIENLYFKDFFDTNGVSDTSLLTYIIEIIDKLQTIQLNTEKITIVDEFHNKFNLI